MNARAGRLLSFWLDSFKGIPIFSWVLLLTIFINAIGQMFTFFSTLYLNFIGFDVELIGIIIASYNMGGLVGTYIGGRLSERFSMITLPGSLLSSSMLLLLILSTGDGILIGSLVCALGIAHNIFKPTSIYLLVRNIADVDKARLLGLRRVALNLGVGIGTIIGGFISANGYSNVFLLESLFSILGFCIFIVCHLHNKKHLCDNISQEQLVVKNKLSNVKSITVLYIVSFLNVMVFSQLFITYPLYLEQYCGFDGKSFATLFTVNTFIIVLIEVPLINILKNVSQYKLLMSGTILLCGGLGLFVLWSNTIVIYLSAISWTIGEIMFFPSVLALIISLSGGNGGQIIGFYQGTYSLAMLCGSSLGGLIYKTFHPSFLWGSCGIIGLTSLITIFVIYRASLSFN